MFRAHGKIIGMVRYDPWVSRDPQKIRLPKRKPFEPDDDPHRPGRPHTLFGIALELMIAPRMGRLMFLALHTPLWLWLVWRTVVESAYGLATWIAAAMVSVMICRRLRDFGFSSWFWAIYAVSVGGGVWYAHRLGLPMTAGFRFGHLFSLPFLILVYLMPGLSRPPFDEDDDD